MATDAKSDSLKTTQGVIEVVCECDGATPVQFHIPEEHRDGASDWSGKCGEMDVTTPMKVKPNGYGEKWCDDCLRLAITAFSDNESGGEA